MAKRLRVALLGSGKTGDAWRVSLPTYQLIDMDTSLMTAIVDVPDDACPAVLSQEPVTTTNDAKYGQIVTGLSQVQKGKTALYFDTCYAEHAGKFFVDAK